MSTKPRVVVVGSTNTDLVVSVPKIPAPGETVLGGSLQTVAGGKGANQAVAAARLGAEVAFVARVGDDAFGSQALAGFQADGLLYEFVTVTQGVASGVALIAIDEHSAENSIVVAPGANAHLTAQDVEDAALAFDAAKAVVVSLEIPMDAVTRAVEMGFARGVPVILNPAPARPLSPELLAKVAVLTPNETEARQIFGDDTNAVGDAVRLGQIGAVVVTCGADGATIYTRDGITHVPSFPVQPVDTVAAGDCFTGALAVVLAEGASLPEAVRFANAAAALKVTRCGAQPGIPYRAQVEAFLRPPNASR
jgi:ribokinase